mgnify:CR=1 FL=1
MKNYVFLLFPIFALGQQIELLPNPEVETIKAEASCGICMFDMQGKSCELAVRFKGDSYYVEGAGIDGANVFARIYQGSSAVAQSKYWDGAIASTPNVDLNAPQPPTADPYNFGGNSGVDLASFSTVIPEPATIGLMGIAAAGLFTARRKVRA